MILSYSRDYHLPAINVDAVNPASSDSHRSRQWAFTVSFLQDECTAFAYLAQTVAAMPPDDLSHQRALHVESLSFKVKSVELLRQRLLTSVNDPATHRAMELLMAGAVYSQDFTIAKHHADMLAHLFQTARAPADPLLIWEAVYDDNQRAAMSLTRPSFDVDGWVADVCAPHFKPLADSLPTAVKVEAAANGLDPSLDDMSSRSAIIYARHTLAIFLLCIQDQTFSSPHLFSYMRYLVAVSINKLLNSYMDSLQSIEARADQRRQSGANTNHVQLWARVQAYASLASVVWIRFVAMIDNKYVTRGFTLWKANDMLLERTKQILIDTDKIFDDADQVKYARIKLWTLYVGAYFEQLQARQDGDDNASGHWYNVKLIEQTNVMGLTTWDSVRDVLLGFLHADILEPHGSVWFERN
jgi:hypothetical protein